MDVSHGWLAGITYTPPLGSTAIVFALNASVFCHSIVFPSADSFVTQEAGGIWQFAKS